MRVLLISVFSTVSVYHVSVEPEDIKKLGSTLNTLCNEKVKAQKVSEAVRHSAFESVAISTNFISALRN